MTKVLLYVIQFLIINLTFVSIPFDKLTDAWLREVERLTALLCESWCLE